jgi:hypothetical protein
MNCGIMCLGRSISEYHYGTQDKGGKLMIDSWVAHHCSGIYKYKKQ